MPDAPAVLLAEGDAPHAFTAPRVAVVGTRAATPHGLADAYELGTYLAEGDCTVVSGLAIGIAGPPDPAFATCLPVACILVA